MVPRSVIFLIDELDRWCGTETHLGLLISQLDRQRIRPVVAIIGQDRLADDFRALGAEVHSLDIRKILAPEGLRGISAVADLLQRTGAKLLVCYHTAADLVGPLAGIWRHVPSLSCRRDTGFTKKSVHITLQRRINHLLMGMISVSHAVVEVVHQVEGFPAHLNQVIWNGEDLDVYRAGPSPARQQLGIPPEACVLCCVGSLTLIKDHPTHIEAFGRLVRSHPDLHLIMAGEGPLREVLQSNAAPFTDRVHFLGQRDDVPDLLRASDIYVQTSLTEGFSNAILQAMASSLPVVATRVGGNIELVKEGTGALVRTGDVDGVAAALERLVSNPELRRSMGQQARRHVEAALSKDIMVARYTDAFERAMEGRFPGPSPEA